MAATVLRLKCGHNDEIMALMESMWAINYNQKHEYN